MEPNNLTGFSAFTFVFEPSPEMCDVSYRTAVVESERVEIFLIRDDCGTGLMFIPRAIMTCVLHQARGMQQRSSSQIWIDGTYIDPFAMINLMIYLSRQTDIPLDQTPQCYLRRLAHFSEIVKHYGTYESLGYLPGVAVLEQFLLEWIAQSVHPRREVEEAYGLCAPHTPVAQALLRRLELLKELEDGMAQDFQNMSLDSSRPDTTEGAEDAMSLDMSNINLGP